MKIFFTLIIIALGFASCEDDAVKAVLKSDVTPNVLQSPSSDAYVLTIADKDEVMETFEWTAPDFGFTASTTYVVQMDVSGNNFANAITVGSVPTRTNLEVNTGVFNDLLLGLGLAPEEAGNVDIRVVSTIGTNVPPVYSNVETISVTAYATSFPPIYGMGAGLKGWGPWPGNAVEWQSSEFKKYETITYFTNGQAFRWFAQLDWSPVSYNYPFFTTVDPIFENANDDDSNLRVVGPTGWYKVNVDLSAKTVVAVAVDEPVLYMMGGALNGWGPWPGAAVKMTYIKPGVFEAEITLTNDIFRFFKQADWGDSYNYNDFTTVDTDLELNPEDNDNNFRYVGTPGTTKITVNLNEGIKSVVLGNIPDPVLFITGDDFGWDWVADKYVEMTYKGGNTFETTATLTNNNLFRFFPQKGWSPSYNFSYFTTVDSELENQGGTDENFRYLGATGSRKITVNMTTKAVSID